MAMKADVLRLMDEQPHWSSQAIADRLGCHPAYVRSTASRAGRSFRERQWLRPHSVREDNLLALGRAAREAGLTLEALESMTGAA